VSDLGVKGTEYHEAFHAVTWLYLDPVRRQKVFEDAKRLYGENLTEEQLEEKLAEDFREYMLTSGLSMKEKSTVRRFFSELLELLTALFKDGFAGYRKMQLQQQINRGKFANRTGKMDNVATRWMKAIPGVTWSTNTVVMEELQGVLRTNLFDAIRNGNVYGYPGMDTFERLAAASEQDVRRNHGEESSKWEETTRALLNVAFDGPMAWASADAKAAMKLVDPNMAAIENVDSLMGADRAAIIEHFAKDAATQKYVKGLVESVDTAGTTENEQYDDDRFQKMNPKDSLSATVRDIIQGTPLITRQTAENSPKLKEAIVAAELAMKDALTAKELGNTKAEEQALEQLDSSLEMISELVGNTAHVSYFGMPRGMNLDLNFPFLSQRLSDASTFEEMISRLHDLGSVYPEFSLLAARLMSEGQDVQAQFFAGFRRTSTEEVQVTNFKATVASPFSGTLTSHNQSGVARALADLDPTKVVERAEKLKKAANGKTVGEAAAMLEEFLTDIGFSTLDPAALGVKLLDVAANPQAYNNLLERVKLVVGAYKVMTAEGLEEAQYRKAASAFRAQIGKMVAPFEAYDRGAVSSTLTNVEGTRVFSKQVPAFIGRWFDSIKRQTGETNEAWGKRLRENQFADPRMMATSYGQMLFKNGTRFQPEAAEKLTLLRVGGLTKGDGIGYSNMTGAEWATFRWSALRGVEGVGPMWPITTPSDAGGSYMVPVQVYDPATEAGRTKTLKALRGIVAAEVMELRSRRGRFSNPKVDAYMKDQFAATEATRGEAFWQIGTTAENNEAIDRAAEILLEELLAEAEMLRENRDFTDAVEALPKWMQGEDLYAVPARMAVTGFIANWSHSVALAGTHNEFKQKHDGNTVDMQKRHKHVMSPSVPNAGVSSKREFVSVTITDKKFNLSEDVPALSRWKQYGGVEIADAQSYVTLDFYKYILLEHGDMTPDMEEVFEALENGEPLTMEMKNKLLRPYKPFYYTRIMGPDGMLRSVQIKNSIIPLVPGLSKGHDQLAKFMSDNGIDQAQMGTAQKVGTPVKADGKKNTADLVNDNGEFEVVNFDDSMKQVLPMDGYGKQVQVTDHLHSDSTNKVLSQMERISIAYAVRHLGDKGRTIRNEFMDALDSVYSSQAEEFFGQFKDESGNFSKEAFGKWVMDEAVAADATEAQLKLIESGQLTAPQVVGLVRSRVFSAIDNQAKQVRVLGGTGVQISSQFHRNRGERLKGMRIENGKVMPAQIALSRDFLPKKYRNMSIAELREEHPEVLEMFTARIPSEGMNSGSLVEVVEFLPEGMDGVVVPDEFVTQMGSDFDVDKLFFVWKDHLNPDAPMNRLYDAMTAPYREEQMLPFIQAPQGFDTIAGIAEVHGLRTAEEQEYIKNNPYSVLTHQYLTGDNKAGIALKGQAANKNLILLDFIRNEFVFDSTFNLGNRSVAKFNWKDVSPETIALHAELVAAAMDGAKDPVYGKLGVNNRNFGLFESLLLMADGMPSFETYVHPETKDVMPIPGNLSFAVAVMQSEPGRLMSNGDIVIIGKGKKTEVRVGNDSPAGLRFLEMIAEAAGTKISEDGTVTLPANRNIKNPTATDAKSLMFLTSGIGQFKKHIESKIKEQGDAMRIDRRRTSDYIETIAHERLEDYAAMNSVEDGPVTEMSYRGKDGERTSQPFDVPTKGSIRSMFERGIDVLTLAGDGYLGFRRQMSGSFLSKALTFAHYDAYIAAKAANEEGALNSTYAAMGERETRAVESLPENREEYSLEQWHRHFSRSKELLLTNEDLSLVLSKMLLQPAPYKFPDGSYADNFSVIGISDDIEKAEVQKAVDRLWVSGDTDIRMFLEQMVTYEAQRSRFGMSQARFTAILPTELQERIAKSADTSAISDGAAAISFQDLALDIHRHQAHNSNARWLGEYDNAADAIVAAETSTYIGARRAVIKGEQAVIIPVSETEDGIEYAAYPSPNNGEKFAGKPLSTPLFEGGGTSIELSDGDFVEEESRLKYGKELHASEKIAHLERRFRNAGVPVTVVMDASLPSNGKVKIDKETATVYLHPDMLQGDTIAHEFGHILVEGLGWNHPLVVQGIQELKGSELWAEVEAAYPDLSPERLAKEVLVTALGREASDLFTERKAQTRFQTLMNRIMRAIGKLFGIQPKATRQLAEMLMGEGSMPTLNLAGVETTEEQRAGKRRSGKEVADDFQKKWADLWHQLNTRKYTNTQFEIEAAKLRAEVKSAATGGVGKKLVAINQVAQNTIIGATTTTSKLANMTANGFNSPAMSTAEAAILADAHTALQRLETMRQVLEGMDPEEGGHASIQDKYDALQEQYDIITRAEVALKEVLAATVSKQLVTNSKNPKVREFVEQNGQTIFDMVNDPELRSLMTDVSAIEKGTLGVKEFKNPVMQLIAKQLQQTVETARLDGRQAEMKIADIMKEAAAAGVELEHIVDTTTGKFKTEFSPAYTEGARKARLALQSGKEMEWIKFHLENSSMKFAREYYQQFQAPTIALRRMAEEVKELNNAIKSLGLKSLDSQLEATEKRLHEVIKAQAGLITKFHDVNVKDGFEAARNEAGQNGAEALERFDAKHGVVEVNGVHTPLSPASRFVELVPKAEYVNDAYTGTNGEPVPLAKHVNPAYASMSPAARKALKEVRDVMAQAMGRNSKDFESGDIPFFATEENKEPASLTERLKARRKSAEQTFKDLKEGYSEKQGERVLVDANGNPIYTRNYKLKSATAEQVKNMGSLENLGKHLGEAAKQAHTESAKALIEPFSYLTRDIFNATEIVDGRHVILTGKKNNRVREFRKKQVAGTNISVALDQWLEGMLGDNWEDAHSLDPLVSGWQQYTSLMGVGINLSAWFNNYAYGNVQRWLEVRGEEFYGKENGKRARKLLGANVMGLTADIINNKRADYSSNVSALVNLLDIADDQRELPFGKRESFNSKLMNSLYVGQTMGEVLMQNEVAFGMMMEIEAVRPDGTKTNLFDAFMETFDNETGVIGMPDVKIEKNGELVQFTTADLAAFRNKAKSVNHYIHGAYNKQDAGTWQRQFWGRALMQFRRWLPMNMKKRFGSDQFNESRERQEQGWYRSLMQFMDIVLKNAKDTAGMKSAIEAMKDESPHVYRGAMSAAIEIGSGIGMFLLLCALYAMMDEDDEDNYFVGVALNRTQRLMQEMNTYTPWGLVDTFGQFSESPFAAMTRIEGFGTILTQGIEDSARLVFKGEGPETYASGVNKGNWKLGIALAKAAPGLSHGLRLSQMGEMQKQYSLAKEYADWFEK
jgi:hypothetical protein